MGSYLSEPIREKTTNEERNRDLGIRWATSYMQGWRVNMEDAHVSVGSLQEYSLRKRWSERSIYSGSSSSLSGKKTTDGGSISDSETVLNPPPAGEELFAESCVRKNKITEQIGIFGVYDGHGGAEVANFTAKYLPALCNEFGLEDGKEGEVLIEVYHRLDEMLREGVYQEELLQFKRRGQEGKNSGLSAENDPVNAIQMSIQTDLSAAKEKGSLQKAQAAQVMMKMMYLKKLESSALNKENSTSVQGAADMVGCTAVTACLVPQRRRLIVANSGDSRCVMCRSGETIALTSDHKPNLPKERERIQKADGKVEEIQSQYDRVHYRINGNLNLSRAIGDHEYKKRHDLKPEEQMICATPDIHVEHLDGDEEFLVLACDGIWDVMSSEQVVAFVRSRLKCDQPLPLGTICEELLDNCISSDPKETQGLGSDNMTVTIVTLDEVSYDKLLQNGQKSPVVYLKDETA